MAEREKCWYWSEVIFILSELRATDRGCKPVIGLSPGYGACPHIPDIPLILRLCCVPAAATGGGGRPVWPETVTKRCEWLGGTALRCLELTFSSSPLFNSLTSGLTVSPSIHSQYFILPHPPPGYPLPLCSPTSLEQQEVQDRLLTVSPALSYHLLFISLLQTTLYPALPVKYVMFTLYLCSVLSKHTHAHSHTRTAWTHALCLSLLYFAA